MGIADKYASSVEATHNLLVMATPANILIAFRPTSEFMQKMEEVLGEGYFIYNHSTGHFQKFLNDFVLNVYIPQVINQMENYYRANVNGIIYLIAGLDAFQTDRYDYIDYPLLKVFNI